MAGGRPPEYDPEYIMQEMLIWARLPDSLNISDFCTSVRPEIDPGYMKQLVNKSEEFSRVYRIVKAYLCGRRESAVSEKVLDTSAFNRCLHHYDQFVYDHSKEEKIFESSLKEKENIPLNNDKLDKFFENLPHLQTINELRSELDELKRQANQQHASSDKTPKYMGGSSTVGQDICEHPEDDTIDQEGACWGRDDRRC